jgi:hypothetical protein
MEPAKSYLDLLARLKAKFSSTPMHNVRLLGLVFCRPDNKLAREEILPSLGYYHHRSAKNIDFYFAGFGTTSAHEGSDIVISTGVESKPEWTFNLKSFGEFCHEIERRTYWKYSGGSDFMLVNCHYDEKDEPQLDFEGAVILTLEVLRQQRRLPDVGMLFENIFRHCEAARKGDEAWDYGLDAEPGSALMELCKFLLDPAAVGGKPIDAESSSEPAKKIDVKDSAPQTPVLIKGPFRYDLAKGALIVMA